MTTIAYRAGIIAGDGRESYIEDHESAMVARDDCVKVHRLPDGRLFGAARTSEEINILHEALIRSCKWWHFWTKWPEPKLDDINAMVVDKDGHIHSYEGGRWESVDAPYFAVGSGARFALPAMDAGATAEDAVRIGMRRDPFSGGRLTTLRLWK
jgi:hypothetical protein